MSRAASMQVLNQAFANLNNALNSYMANDLSRDKYDTAKTQWQDNFEYNKNKDAQAQSNAERAYAFQQAQANQAQNNWQASFDNNKANADRTFNYNAQQNALNRNTAAEQTAYNRNRQQQTDYLTMAKAVDAAPDEGTAQALAQGLNYGGADPILARAMVGEMWKEKKKKQTQDQYNNLLKDFNAIRNKREQQAKLAAAKIIKPADIATIIDKGMMTPEQAQPYLQKYLSGKAMSPEEALDAFKSGEITKEQLAKIRQGF